MKHQTPPSSIMPHPSSFIPYPSYKPSGVEWLGDVPEHWGVKRLKHVAYLKSGDGITIEEIGDEGNFPVYGGNGFRGFSNKYTHDGEYVLIGRQGALCGNINYAKGKFWASEHAVVLNPPQPIATLWLGELLRIMNLNQYSVSAAQPGLAIDRIKELFLPLPPLPEQQAIAAFLDRETGRIDSLIAKKLRLLELLAEQRTALISRAVTKGLDAKVKLKPCGVEWLGDVPEHWGVKRLKHVAYLKSGDGITIEEIGDEGNFPVYGGNGFRGFSNKYTHDGEYVLIGRQGALCGNINYAKGKFWASEHAVVLNPPQPIATLWLGELLRIMNLNQYSVSAAQPGLAIDRIKELFLPLPPLPEQQAIAAFLDRETAKIDALSAKVTTVIERLKEYRTALISSAVTGKIDVSTELNKSAREAV